jgi:hypothetical protein
MTNEVSTMPEGSGGGGWTTTWFTRFGHGVRRDSNILGTALNGRIAGPSD